MVTCPLSGFCLNIKKKKKCVVQINSGAKTTATIAIRNNQDTFGSVDGIVQQKVGEDHRSHMEAMRDTVRCRVVRGPG